MLLCLEGDELGKVTDLYFLSIRPKNGIKNHNFFEVASGDTNPSFSPSPSELYDKYSQGVEPKGLKTTKQVAVNALSDGVGQQQVKEMLEANDPGYQSLVTSAGNNSANNTLDKIVTSAAAEVKNGINLGKSEEIKKSPALSARA